MIVELELDHQSRQLETGVERQITCRLPVIGIADMAERLVSFGVGDHVRLTGFLASKNRMNSQLVLHANMIETIL